MNVTANFVYDNACIRMMNSARENHNYYTIPYLDMIAMFKVKVHENFPLGVTREMFESLNISEDIFLAKAKLNMIKDLSVDGIESFIGVHNAGESGLVVVSNESNYYGAGVIMVPEIFQSISNYDIFILPSSVHEVLALPDNGNVDVGYLQSLVSTVNSMHVAPEERLTDSVYKYFHKDNEIKKVG